MGHVSNVIVVLHNHCCQKKKKWGFKEGLYGKRCFRGKVREKKGRSRSDVSVGKFWWGKRKGEERKAFVKSVSPYIPFSYSLFQIAIVLSNGEMVLAFKGRIPDKKGMIHMPGCRAPRPRRERGVTYLSLAELLSFVQFFSIYPLGRNKPSHKRTVKCH